MHILDLYKSIVEYAGLKVAEGGSIHHMNSDGGPGDPAMMDGKVLVLPTDEHLANPSPSEKMVFHPLGENTFRGESEILTKLRKAINIRMNFIFGSLALGVLKFATNPDISSKFNPDQDEVLVALKEADKTSIKNFDTILKKMIFVKTDQIFVHCYLRAGATYHGKKHARVGVITFPFYEELLKAKKPEIYGVKVRQKDIEIFKSLCEFILPNLDVAEEYNYGSDADLAPFLDALLFSTAKVRSRFDDIIRLYEDFISDSELLLSNSDWVETMLGDTEALRREVRRIPPQDGNAGRASMREEKEQAHFVPVADVKPEAPQSKVTTEKPSSSNTINWQQLQEEIKSHQQQQPPSNPWQSQQQVYQPPQKSPLRLTESGKLDFNSVLQNNPALNSMPNAFGGPTQSGAWNQPQPVQRVPSWAQPQQQPMYGQPQQQTMYDQPHQSGFRHTSAF